MDTHFLTGEVQRAAAFEYVKLSPGEMSKYKGVPQVDLSMLKTMDRSHAQPANTVDHSKYVSYPIEGPKDVIRGTPVYTVDQTEVIQPHNINNKLFMNNISVHSDKKLPRPSITGQTILK